MKLLEISEISHAYGDKILFEDSGMILQRGERMGITGENGAGKSTLLKICMGEVIPDKGRVLWNSQVSAGYLDQHAQLNQQQTMLSYLRSAFHDLYAMERKMDKLYTLGSAGNTASFADAFQCQSILEEADFYTIDMRIMQVASGLGLDVLGLERNVASISSGQRAKLLLAKLLLADADVLLLDEPTNFLDSGHVTWLAEYIAGCAKSFLIVSHDTVFLQKTVNCICEVKNKYLQKYSGSFADYLRKSEHLGREYVHRYNRQQDYIRKTEEYIRKNKAGNKCKNARGRKKYLERLSRLAAPDVSGHEPVFTFNGCVMTGSKALELSGLTVGYSYPLLSGLNMVLHGGQKVLLKGFNGVGKTTLLETLMGRVAPLGGMFRFTRSAVIGYYAQNEGWGKSMLTPFELVSGKFPQLSRTAILREFSRCGIPESESGKHLCQLSGGEQARIKLCLLKLAPCNFLILDEPTNHLDKSAKAALKKALISFDGTILLVTHEEDFCRNWIDKVVVAGSLHTG